MQIDRLKSSKQRRSIDVKLRRENQRDVKKQFAAVLMRDDIPRRRMIDAGARAVQQFGEDILPLVLLCAVAVTGLMLAISYTWLKGYAYDFLAILHAIVVIVTLLWLPFGKFFHIFQRPAQLGVAFYKDAGQRMEQALCARCNTPFASVAMIRDLITVERELGFRYEHGDRHYQQVCPKCRRALFGLAQGALWKEGS